MHSMVIAEPLGVLIGIITGKLGSRLGQNIAQNNSTSIWAPLAGAAIGAMVGHYLGSVVTKACVNCLAVDPAGLTVNATVTSPATAITHGIIEGLSNIPFFESFDLTSIVSDVMSGDDVHEALEKIPSNMLPQDDTWQQPELVCNAHNSDVRFGGFDHVEQLCDFQGPHPTCFPESAENIIQLYFGDVTGNYNSFSGQIIEYAKANGLAVLNSNTGEWVIPNSCHQAIFSAYGIPTELSDFNHEYFKYYLDHQCPIQLGVDSAYFGNQLSGSHSVTLVDLKQAVDGDWYYRVLDSATPTQQWYPASLVEEAAQSALNKWPDGFNGRALICKASAPRWPFAT